MLARYWRIRAQTVQSGTNFALSEIQLRDVAAGADMTGSGTAISGGDFNTGTNPPANAFDNTDSTWWAGPTNGVVNSWIGYDFGSDIEIVEAVLRARSDTFAQACAAFTIDCSSDGSTWTTVKGYNAATWSAGSSQTFTVPLAAEGAPVRVYAAGVQRVYTPKDPPIRVYALGVQVIRGTASGPPPGPTGRRRQQQNIM